MKYGIPNVVGCVDCVHVPIARRGDDQKKHFNKSYHSKKVQIVSDVTLCSYLLGCKEKYISNYCNYCK